MTAIVTKGSPNVLVNGLPVARQTDTTDGITADDAASIAAGEAGQVVSSTLSDMQQAISWGSATLNSTNGLFSMSAPLVVPPFTGSNSSSNNMVATVDFVQQAIANSGGVTYPIAVNLGGTGANNATDARTNLGLGSAAVQDTAYFLLSSSAGANSGIATLDSTGKLNASQVPQIAISQTFVVNSQSAMLALAADEGDVAVRTDLSESFILTNSNPSSLSSWQQLLSPTSSVQSVFGRTGTVVAASGDYTFSQIGATPNTMAGYGITDGVTATQLAANLANYSLTSSFANVAFSGSYNDLSSKPTIPAAQIQSDWNEANTSLLDYIKNKPTIPTTLPPSGNAGGNLTGSYPNPTINSASSITIANLTANGSGTFTANIMAANFSGNSSGNNTGDQFFTQPTSNTVRTLQSRLEDIISVTDFMSSSQIADTQTGIPPTIDVTSEIQAAIDYATLLGKKVRVPAGKYLINGGLTLNNMSFEGDGTIDLGYSNTTPGIGNTAHSGTSFYATSTSVSAFTVTSGCKLSNFTVYYPNQTAAAFTAANNTPLVYPATINIPTNNENIDIDGIGCPNAYQFAQVGSQSNTNAVGRITFRNLRVYSIYNDIFVDVLRDVLTLDNCSFTFGWWDQSQTGTVNNSNTANNFATWTALNGRSVILETTDGIAATNCFWFAKASAIQAVAGTEVQAGLGQSQYNRFTNCLFDGCSQPVATEFGGYWASTLFNNCIFSDLSGSNFPGNDPFGGISFDSANTSTSMSFTGCEFIGGRGTQIRVNNPITTLTITGCRFTAWKRYANSTAVSSIHVGAPNTNIIINNCYFNAGGGTTAVPVGLELLEFESVVVTGCSFDSCYQPIYVGANSGTLTVTGCQTINTSYSYSVTNASSNVIAFIDGFNNFDKPSQITGGVTAGTYGNSTYSSVLTIGTDGRISNASSVAIAGGSGGGGNVSSVGLSMPSMFTVSNSPVTNSGTLTVTLANTQANYFFAGPISGANAAPTMRLLNANDLPNSGVTSSTYGNSSFIPTITIDSKGRITNAASVALTSSYTNTSITVLDNRTSNSGAGHNYFGFISGAQTSHLDANSNPITTYSRYTHGGSGGFILTNIDVLVTSNGTFWTVDDPGNPALAFLQHIGADQWQWRHNAVSSNTQVTVATLDGSGNFNVIGNVTSNGNPLLLSVVAGTGVTVNNADPKNPVISVGGGGSVPSGTGYYHITSGSMDANAYTNQQLARDIGSFNSAGLTIPYANNFSSPDANLTISSLTGRMQISAKQTANAVPIKCLTTFPTAPYTIDIGMPSIIGSSFNPGIYLSDGTKFITIQAVSTGVTVYEYSTITTSPTSANTIAIIPGVLFLRITDDGTTRTFLFSTNGLDYTQMFSQATNTYLTPNSCGIMYRYLIQPAAQVKVPIYHWKISNTVLGDAP